MEKIESNQIEKQLSLIKFKMGISETAYADNRFCGGGSDLPIGGIVTRRCARSDSDGEGDTGTVDIDVVKSVE